jgi:hypothetical protein
MEGGYIEHPSWGEDPHEQVLPQARFIGYVEDFLGEAFVKKHQETMGTLFQEGRMI